MLSHLNAKCPTGKLFAQGEAISQILLRGGDILAALVAAYALSPIDLIPDFIPVIGYVDDLIIVPLGLWLVISLVPDELMAECRAKADEAASRPGSKAGMIAIILLWIACAGMLGWIAYRLWSKS